MALPFWALRKGCISPLLLLSLSALPQAAGWGWLLMTTFLIVFLFLLFLHHFIFLFILSSFSLFLLFLLFLLLPFFPPILFLSLITCLLSHHLFFFSLSFFFPPRYPAPPHPLPRQVPPSKQGNCNPKEKQELSLCQRNGPRGYIWNQQITEPWRMLVI